MKIPRYYIDEGTTLMHFVKFDRRLPIYGVEGLDYEDLLKEIEKGERFKVYRYSIFLFVLRMSGVSPIYFSKNKFKNRLAQIKYTLLTVACILPIMLFTIFLLYMFLHDSYFELWMLIPLSAAGFFIVLPIPSIIKNILGGVDVTEVILLYIQNNLTKEW